MPPGTELWVLLYLHDWDPVDPVTKVQPVYPEVSGIYDTWEEAALALLSKAQPGQYWVRRGNLRSKQK